MGISKVCFLKRTPFGEKSCYEVDIVNSKEILMSNEGVDIKEISEAKAQSKARRLYEILKMWDKQYVNPSVLDGIEYTFVVEFLDRSLMKVYCKNKAPKNFSEFMRIVEEN